ncbi:MAG: hypothetical protein ABEH88_10910 [Halobacteriales archaeon]
MIHPGDFVSEAAFDTITGLGDGALTAVEDGEVDVSLHEQRERPET